MQYQLELFPLPLEEQIAIVRMECKKSIDNMRRGLFRENSILKKELSETKHKLETLEAAICKNDIKTIRNLF